MGIAEKAVPFSFAEFQSLERFRLALFRRFFASDLRFQDWKILIR